MKLKSGHSVDANAREVLPKLARKYFETGRDAVSRKRPPDELHGFRLETKRFRYTLELFRPVYGPQLDRYLKALHELQGALGKVSDYQAIQRVVRGDRALEDHLRRTLKKKVRDLRHEWRAFDSEGELKRWRSYLAGQHSKPRTPRTAAKKTAGRARG
jgi:CHAD domain-containing protein